MNYPQQVKEFARVRMEQSPNNTQIARDIKNKFSTLYADKELDGIRRRVSEWREKWGIDARKIPIKRLFLDIETGYYEVLLKTFSLRNNLKYFPHDSIVKQKQIFCVSYKWQYEDKVHTLDWRMGEKEMIKAFVNILGEAHEAVGHNVNRFDIKELRTRAIYHGVLMFPNYRTLDTLTKARQYFNFASNKLDYIGDFLNVGRKLDHEGFELWEKVSAGDEQALEKMIRYCENDVVLLEDAFFVLSPFINHNNNFAVLTGGKRWHCPECASKDVKMFRTYSTPMGIIRREMKCNTCKKQYRVSNKTYLSMLEDSINNQ
jgi:hypothetical protein